MYYYNTYTGEKLKVAASFGCIFLPINTMLEESGVRVGFKAGVGVRVSLKITDSASPGQNHVGFKLCALKTLSWIKYIINCDLHKLINVFR